MLFVYIVIIIGMVWIFVLKQFRHTTIARYYVSFIGGRAGGGAGGGGDGTNYPHRGSSIMESISKYLIYSNSYVRISLNSAASARQHFISNRHFRSGINLNLAQHQTVWYQNA